MVDLTMDDSEGLYLFNVSLCVDFRQTLLFAFLLAFYPEAMTREVVKSLFPGAQLFSHVGRKALIEQFWVSR